MLEELEKEGIETFIVEAGNQPFGGCVGCGGCGRDGRGVFDDQVNEWAGKMAAAVGVLIGTPVDYAGINGTLKSFLDRAFYSHGKQMRHKVGAGLAAVRRTGGMPALEDINRFFTISEMLIPSSSYWNVIHGRVPGEARQDEEGKQTMRTLGRNMAWLLKMRQKGLTEAPDRLPKIATNFIR